MLAPLQTLAGEDFDVAVLNHLNREFKKESGIDLSNDRLAMQRLREVRFGSMISVMHTNKH